MSDASDFISAIAVRVSGSKEPRTEPKPVNGLRKTRTEPEPKPVTFCESKKIDERQRQCQRQREYRKRDRAGEMWASAFVPCDLVEKLIEGGLLPESESADKKSLGAALVEAASHWSKSVMG